MKAPERPHLNFRNGLALLYKHLSPTELIWVLPCRFVLDWVAAVMFLLQRQGGSFTAVLKAHIHFIRQLPVTHRKRVALRREYPAYSKSSMYSRSVLFQYYLLGRKKFTELAGFER